MRWDQTADGGFSITRDADPPWLPVGGDVGSVNVVSQLDDPESILNLYRRLLEFRKSSVALRRGSFLAHPVSNE
jgi:alpha-glucosidase